MANSLFFVLAPATGLPQGPLSWADLADAHSTSASAGGLHAHVQLLMDVAVSVNALRE